MIEQTKTRLQETLEFRKTKQMEIFSFSPPINLSEKGKRLLAVKSFKTTKSVSKETDESTSFSISITGPWQTKSDEKTIDELNNLLELKSQNCFELHVKEVKKRGNQMEIGDIEYKLSDSDAQKNEILEGIKNAKYNYLDDLVYRFQLRYDEIMDIIDLKHIPTKKAGSSLNPSINKVVDSNKTIKHILPDNVRVCIRIDDIRLKSNLNIKPFLFFTNKTSFYTLRGFAPSHLYPLDDIEGFCKLIAGSDRGKRPVKFTGIDKVHLKCDCIQGSVVNAVRKPFLYNFALYKPPGQEIYNQPRVKLFKIK